MPRTPLHTLMWSGEHNRYDLYIQGHLAQPFRPEDREAWLAWLETVTSFAFRGACGNLNVYQEARRRGGRYWYAYATTSPRTHKRYLGPTAGVTFTRLEEVAKALGSASSPTPLAPERGPQERDAASHQAGPGPARQVSHRMELLSTRLSHPVLSPRLLGRERLLHRLDEARFHRLTLLSASAGWGKTTLLSTWASRSTWPIAWLSLDELDNDPARFWFSVLAALRICLPGVGEAALSMLRSPQPPPLSDILTALLNELSGQDTPIFLLLDDYHLIDEQAIHDSVLFLLEHLPAHLHLVLSSRIDPPLLLARWRVRGQLLELRDADLRFAEEEAAQFLTRTMDLSLEVEEIAELAHRTEGWIAGLQLAALSLVHHADRAAFVRGFTGSHRYVLDYVQEDILAHLSSSIQTFVLSTSILNRMSASLCEAVTQQAASREVLETLERANLFLVHLDDERLWYRFHDLFREALLARLQATRPEAIPLLHRRAARWYEEQGEFREAISHWLAAQDFSSAVRLMEQAAPQLRLRGESEIFYHWVMALPEPILREHASFALTIALYLLISSTSTMEAQQIRVQTRVEQMATRVEMALQQEQMSLSAEAAQPDACSASLLRNQATEQAVVHRRLCLLRLHSKWLEGLMVSDYEIMKSLLEQMQHLDEDDEVAWQLVPLGNTFIYHATLRQEGAILVPRLLAAKQQVSQSGDRYATLKVMQWLAIAFEEAGQLYQAHQECLAGLGLLEQFNGYALLAGYFYSVLATVHYQWNQLDEARRVLRKMIHDAAAYQQTDLHMVGCEWLLMVELAAGDLEAAEQVLQEGEQLALHLGQAPQRYRLVNMRVRYWLAQGNLSRASDWASSVSLPQESWDPHHYDAFAMLIRVSFARQQWMQALELLERFSTHLDRPGIRSWTTTMLLSLYVVALSQTGEMEQARAALMRLLALTEPGGYLRLYLDMGEAMRQLLKTLQSTPQNDEEGASPIPRAYISTLLSAFEQEERQGQRVEPSPTMTNQLRGLPDDAHPSRIEALTPQEQRVLQSLCTGRSNREIADELVVSINTVKAHVKKIYSKLHVHNRIEACRVARAVRLFFEKTFATGSSQSTP
jgi:LuxR family maltose regulon positive regulatory protein